MTPVLLKFHIACGVVALVLGPIAMNASKRRGPHTRLGEVYHGAVFLVCLTAGMLAVLDWGRIGWFLPVAAFSYAFALLGYLSSKRRRAGWLRWHIAGMGGSYIAIVTALLVVNWRQLTGVPGIGSPWPWMLPTILGSPAIAWVIRQVRLGRRPKR